MAKFIIRLLTPLLLAVTPFSLIAQDTTREITKIAGDVYRFQNNFHYSIFVITADGVVVTDPISADAAEWLNGEIEKMTDLPITHLIYSHSHADHASGGAFFGDVPNVIAHENAPEDIDVVTPTERFADTMAFSHGGKTFELTYLGPGHGTDLIAIVVRPENIGFIVDTVTPKRVFFRDFPNANVDQWIDQVRKVETLDFDILAGGHGELGVKADATDGRIYLEELRAEVLAGLQAGKTADELSQPVMMEKYKDWGNYDQWRALNVQGMARHLKESGAVN
jgi:glyoxylase-like metal-dependent hydrolase (beta-lactamase superfamily II)